MATNPNESLDESGSQPGRPVLREWLLERMRTSDLTPKQLAVAKVLEADPHAASIHTAVEIAKKADVNVASVVRFAQRIGFTGWPQLQTQMRNMAMTEMSPSDFFHRQGLGDSANPMEATLYRDMQNMQTLLETIDLEEGKAIAELIARSGRTLVISSGSWTALGHILAYNARAIGLSVATENRGGANLLVELGALTENDCVVGISFGRLSREVVRAMQSVAKRGIPTVAITNSAVSPLTATARHSLVVPTDGLAYFLSLTAAASAIYGLLATLREILGPKAEEHIRSLDDLFDELDVLYL